MSHINKGSSLKVVSANNHSRFGLPCEGTKNTNGCMVACIHIIDRVRDHSHTTCTKAIRENTELKLLVLIRSTKLIYFALL